MADSKVPLPDLAPADEGEAEPPPPSPRCPFCGSRDTGVSRTNAGMRHLLLWLGGGAIHACDLCRRRFVVCAVAGRHPRKLWNAPGVCVALALRGRLEPVADVQVDAGDDSAVEPLTPAEPSPPTLEALDWLWVAGSTGLGLAGLGAALGSLLTSGVARAGLWPLGLAIFGVGLALALAGALLAHLGHVDPDRDYRARPFTRAESRRFGFAGFLAHALGLCVLAALVLVLAYAVLRLVPPPGAAPP